MSQPKVEITEHSETKHSVKIEAPLHSGKRDTIPHLVVKDILAFADTLRQANAPEDGQVRALWATKDGYLLRNLAVYWSEKQNLINGQPMSEAAEEKAS